MRSEQDVVASAKALSLYQHYREHRREYTNLVRAAYAQAERDLNRIPQNGAVTPEKSDCVSHCQIYVRNFDDFQSYLDDHPYIPQNEANQESARGLMTELILHKCWGSIQRD